MLRHILRKITCNHWPSSKPQPKTDGDIALLSVDKDKKGQENTAIKGIEIHADMEKGLGKDECQDSFAIHSHVTSRVHFFAVYDGHGFQGKQVSEFVRDQVTLHLQRNVSQIENPGFIKYAPVFLKNTFKVVEDKLLSTYTIDSHHSGTCCILVIVTGIKCIIVNIGDSRAVLGKEISEQKYQSIDLSHDHKPSDPIEQDRILKNGGYIGSTTFDDEEIGPLRVWTKKRDVGLAMTRAIGDTHGKTAGVISEPEIKDIDLESSDRFIIVASDGLWDVMTSEEAVNFVVAHEEAGHSRKTVAKAMIREAEKRWREMIEKEGEGDEYRDDITVIVAYPDWRHLSQETRDNTKDEMLLSQKN